MEGSRDRILKFLQRHNGATVERIARHMELAVATVRRHLDILQRDLLVIYSQVNNGTGRPSHTYHLTEVGQEQQPKDYDRLLSGVLSEIATLSTADQIGRDGKDMLELTLERMATRTVADAEQTSDPTKDRVERLVGLLDAQKFEPEVEVGDGEIRVLLHNCPFRRVAMAEPRVCAYDRAVVSGLLGTEVTRRDWVADGAVRCCYVVPGSAVTA